MEYIVNYTVVENKKLNENTFLLTLKGPTDWIKCGKFLNILIPNKLLRRPMSVFSWNINTLTILYKVFGEGTKYLTTLNKNNKVNILIDLGNSYNIKKDKKQIVVCGGSGICSIYALLKELKNKHVETICVVGFKTKNEVVLEKELKALVNKLIICTDDGTYGFKGNVVDAINYYKLNNLYYYCCGNTPLMRAVLKACKNGQLSLEARMGCGFGACMGCSIKTKQGNKRICKDGAIFEAKDLYEI
mgnify:FL=1